MQKLLLWGPFRILVIIDGLPFMFLDLDIFQSRSEERRVGKEC